MNSSSSNAEKPKSNISAWLIPIIVAVIGLIGVLIAAKCQADATAEPVNFARTQTAEARSIAWTATAEAKSVLTLQTTQVVVAQATILPSQTPSSTFTPVPSAAIVVGKVIPVGNSEGRFLGVSSLTVSDCDGDGTATIQSPISESSFTDHSVEWSINGSTGTGLSIPDSVIPGGADLGPALVGLFKTPNISEIYKTYPNADPFTVVIRDVTWSELWQPGQIQIKQSNQRILSVDVKYRTEIKVEFVHGTGGSCGSRPTNTPIPIPTTPIPPTRPIPTPSVILFDGFEGAQSSLILFSPDPQVFNWQLTNAHFHSGKKSLCVNYVKSNTYQYVGGELPTNLRNLTRSTKFDVWVFGQVDLLFKLEDETGRQADVETLSATNPNGWTRLRFDYSNAAGSVDLSRIKVIFFFPAPGDPTAKGQFCLDDLGLPL